jgi:hypothetical protein
VVFLDAELCFVFCCRCFYLVLFSLQVELDELVEDISLDRVREDLPESVPRFLVLSYPWKLDNDRVSYPLVFVYYAPEASAKLNMLYASTKSRLSRALELNKEFDIHTRDELTETWLKQKLDFFK